MEEHMKLTDMPEFCAQIEDWLKARYGEVDSTKVWKATGNQYNKYLEELPDYGGKKTTHALAIWKHHYFLHVSITARSSTSRRITGVCHKSVYVRF